MRKEVDRQAEGEKHHSIPPPSIPPLDLLFSSTAVFVVSSLR